jgi:hypothetical protein
MLTDEEKQEEMQRANAAASRERRIRKAEDAVNARYEALKSAWLIGGLDGLREKRREMNPPSQAQEERKSSEGEVKSENDDEQ